MKTSDAILHDDIQHTSNENLVTYRIIWLPASDGNSESNRQMQEKMCNIISHFKKFKDADRCREHIEQLSETERIILITNEHLGQLIIPRVHSLPQVSSIYVHQIDPNINVKWNEQFTKIKGVFVCMDELVRKLQTDQLLREKAQEHLSISIFSTDNSAGESTTEINGQFVFSQLLIDCFLRINPDPADTKELISIWENEYKDNPSQLSFIRNFRDNYSSDDVLRWYTRETFFYRILNKALRTQNIHLLFLCRSFITDLYHKLQRYRSESPVRVYRCQLMSSEELRTLQRYNGVFISVNSFFSTSTNSAVADLYCAGHMSTTNLEPVLFVIDANPKFNFGKPFANISRLSHFPDESEVLFMAGSVFRLLSITYSDHHICTIHMELCAANKHRLEQVLVGMKYLNGTGERSLHSFARLLWEMGQFDLAEKYYIRLQNEVSLDDPWQKTICHELATILSQKGQYNASMLWRAKALQMKEYGNLTLEKKIEKIERRSYVYLTRKGLSYQDMKIIVKRAIIDKQCVALDLRHNNITSDGFSILANALHDNRTLEKLDLSDNFVCEKGIRYITHTINSSNISILVLNFNGIGCEGAYDLAEMLKTNRTLTYLGLDHNLIGSLGVKHLSQALSVYNATLQELSLVSNKRIDHSSVADIDHLIRCNKTLSRLDMHSCSITVGGQQRLRETAKGKPGFELVTFKAATDPKLRLPWIKKILSRTKSHDSNMD